MAACASLAACARTRPDSLAAASLHGTQVHGTDITIYPFRREDIENLGVPCIGVTLGDSIPGVMFLTHYEVDNAYRWSSNNHYSMVTRSGRIVSTKGMRRDLQATRFSSTDPLQELPLMGTSSLGRELDFIPGDNVAVGYVSRLEEKKEEFLTILEQTYSTVRIEEVVEVQRWSWRVTNTYWMNKADGNIIRSVQHISPDLPRVVIDLFRAPA